MSRDIALLGRMEVEANRRFSFGMTASEPDWTEVDLAGNKGWVIDVFMGPEYEDNGELHDNILKDVPIAEFARAHVGEKNIPVLLERTRQMGWTVAGRSHVIPGGFQSTDILEETYNRIEHNYRDLRLLHVPDLDFTLETLGEGVARWNSGDESVAQIVRAFDAFGVQIYGPEVASPPQDVQDRLEVIPLTRKTVRHLKARMETLGESVARWNSGDVSRAQKDLHELTVTVT